MESVHSDVVVVVVDWVVFWVVLVEDIDWELTADLVLGLLLVVLSAEDLVVVVDALFGNVFAHTLDGMFFAVRLAVLFLGGVVLIVVDRGFGLSFGLEWWGASGGDSIGFGFDIVCWVALVFGGRLEIRVGWVVGVVIEMHFGGS